MATITMVSLTGREVLTEETIRNYCGRGGGAQYPIDLFYFAPEGKHIGLAAPPNVTVHIEGYNGMMPDFWKMLLSVPDDQDWIFLEDDCAPCKRALEFMVRVDVPDDVGVLSFFDLRNEFPSPGIHRNKEWDSPGNRRHLYGAQALKIPARVLPQLKAYAREQRRFSANWDTWTGLAIDDMKLRVAHYAPSLVQHLGAISVAYPGTTHTRPTTLNFPGEDFDAFDVSPDPIKPGKWTDTSWDWTGDPNWCNLHKRMHAGGNRCPKKSTGNGISKFVEVKLPPQNLQQAFEAGFEACCGHKPGERGKAFAAKHRETK